MPPDLLKAHQHLDALVDKAYGKKFVSDAERVAHLFDIYAYPPPQGAAKRSATRGATVKEK